MTPPATVLTCTCLRCLPAPAALVVASSGSGELGAGDLFAPPSPFPSSPERSASLASPAARRTESCPRQSSEFLPSAGGSGGTAGGNGGTGLLVGSGAALPGSAARSASVSSHCSLARQASIASSAAAALLRQASLQSDVSFLFDDADSNLVASPHSSEVEGFEGGWVGLQLSGIAAVGTRLPDWRLLSGSVCPDQ